MLFRVRGFLPKIPRVALRLGLTRTFSPFSFPFISCIFLPHNGKLSTKNQTIDEQITAIRLHPQSLFYYVIKELKTSR